MNSPSCAVPTARPDEPVTLVPRLRAPPRPTCFPLRRTARRASHFRAPPNWIPRPRTARCESRFRTAPAIALHPRALTRPPTLVHRASSHAPAHCLPPSRTAPPPTHQPTASHLRTRTAVPRRCVAVATAARPCSSPAIVLARTEQLVADGWVHGDAAAAVVTAQVRACPHLAPGPSAPWNAAPRCRSGVARGGTSPQPSRPAARSTSPPLPSRRARRAAAALSTRSRQVLCATAVPAQRGRRRRSSSHSSGAVPRETAINPWRELQSSQAAPAIRRRVARSRNAPPSARPRCTPGRLA